MKGKGIAYTTLLIFVSTITVGLILVIILMFFGQYIDIHSIVQSAEVERHAIVIGNVFLSSPRLVYEKDDILYRGVFDKDKLDKELINENIWTWIMKELRIPIQKEIFNEISYPDSTIVLEVYDLEANQGWFLIGGAPEQLTQLHTAEWEDRIKCLITKIKIEPNMIFRMNFPMSEQLGIPFPIGYGIPSGPWEHFDLQACEEHFKSKIGNTEKSFPVAIKFGDDVHVGVMLVGLAE